LVADTFTLPPVTVNETGQERKVGFEIEFSGLKIAEITKIVHDLYGGEVVEVTPYKVKVEHTAHGTFGIELDFRFLKEELLKEQLQEMGLIEDKEDLELIRKIEELIASLSEPVVPYEIGTPPILISRLGVLDALEERLRMAGAQGTDASLFYAFGLHINPETPSFEADVLLDFLRAFLILYEWLVYINRTDILRRMTPYIRPFEDRYTVMVLEPEYRPDLSTLIDDYLVFNPTRNRPLDMLPLFAWIDEERVRQAVDDPRISKRPTFHYRLPDCRIDREIHNIAHAWNGWVEVEKLAYDKPRLRRYAKAYLDYLEDPFAIFDESWANKMEKMLRG
jgi:hypothetical protein